MGKCIYPFTDVEVQRTKNESLPQQPKMIGVVDRVRGPHSDRHIFPNTILRCDTKTVEMDC